MGESVEPRARDARGRYALRLFKSVRGNLVPASGANREQRDTTRKLLVDLVNTPLRGRSQRDVNALLVIGEALAQEVEMDGAQIIVESERRERRYAREGRKREEEWRRTLPKS